MIPKANRKMIPKANQKIIPKANRETILTANREMILKANRVMTTKIAMRCILELGILLESPIAKKIKIKKKHNAFEIQPRADVAIKMPEFCR